MQSNFFDSFIIKHGVVILDGAMATELEKHGADLNHVLWSAKLLTENPALIKRVHLDYLNAGADILTTASYQASFTGFAKQGYSKEKAAGLMKLATTIAIQARDEFVSNNPNKKPLIAASLGPYGASLADGSEYRGDYGLTVEELMEFHRERMAVLAASGADLIACETIPCPEEALALIRLLKEFPDTKAWISFSCRNETEVSNGTSFAAAADLVNSSEQVVAVGVNCTAPQFVESLVRIAFSVTDKLVLAYPNRGGAYDSKTKCWLPASTYTDFTQEAIRWRNAGARLIGGCCRTTPDDIKKIAQGLHHIDSN
jgi:homocysteine S-methyltransferase